MKALNGGAQIMRRAKNRLLKDHGWNDELHKAYLRLKLALILAVKRAYRNPSMIPVLMWDASKFAWSYTIGQIHPDQLKKPWTEWEIEMLVTRSGIFDRTQYNWDIGSKEDYPPWRAIKKDGNMLRSRFGFIAAGDHRNITYIQVASLRPACIGTASKERMQRWCLDWAHEDFKIYSVPGDQNLFNEFHTRSGAPEGAEFYTLQQHAEQVEAKLAKMKRSVEGNPASQVLEPEGASDKSGNGDGGKPKNQDTDEQKHVHRQFLVITPQNPPVQDALDKHEHNLAGKSLLPDIQPMDWPSVEAIAASQRRHLTARTRRRLNRMESAVPNVHVYLNQEGKIVIPTQDSQLRINMIAAAHQGKHGHCKHKQTVKLINEVFTWHGMNDEVQQWVARCLQCIKLAGGGRIPRPMGHQLLAQKPMEVVALDFMSIRANRWGGYKHILVIVDQLTRICVLVPTKNQTAATAARIFCERWLAFFPEPTFVISDGGPHFTAELFREIAVIRGFNHHIVAPYSQWSNGGVERLNQVVEDKLTAILNSRGDPWTAWPAWTSAIQEAANKRIPISSRGYRTPMELLMGQKPKSALKYIAWMGVDAEVRADVDPTIVEPYLADIHEHLPELWAKAVQAQKKRRRQNSKPGIGVPRIHVGDLVLVADAVPEHKLRMRWTGPHEVVAVVNKSVQQILLQSAARGTATAKAKNNHCAHRAHTTFL